MRSCAHVCNPADCTLLFFTRLLLLAFALVTIGLGRALAQCPIVAPGPTWNVDGCTLTLSASASVSGVSIGVNAPGELDLNSNVTLTASNSVSVGYSAAGTLNVFNGGVINDADGVIGFANGVTGNTAVNGAGSRWNNSNSLTVGESGTGRLTISAGGQISVPTGYIGANGGSTGSVTVSGAGSELNDSMVVWVGESGQGALTIQNGASASDALGALIGQEAGSVGQVTVAGSGSQWDSGDEGLIVGGFGHGALQVQNGGVLAESSNASNDGAYIGWANGSMGAVTVTGSGSQWDSTGSGILYVGYAATGSLTIANGGLVADQAASVGNNAVFPQMPSANGQGSGSVVVSGSGSTWNNATTLDIGNGGKGTLTVGNGGLVSAQTITIDTQGTVNAKGGTLQGTVVNHGVLDPLGTITINGDYTQGVDGTLILDVAGTGAGEFGQLDVSGNATFGGTIQFDFINGFAPSAGDSFDFINVGGSADFSGATIDIGGLLPGFDYSDSFQNGQFILTALNDGVASSPTPEPGTLLLFGTAVLGLLAVSRRMTGARER